MSEGSALAMIPWFLRSVADIDEPTFEMDALYAEGLAGEIRHLEDELEKARKLAGEVERAWEADIAQRADRV